MSFMPITASYDSVSNGAASIKKSPENAVDSGAASVLTVAKFSDIYKSHVAAIVDKNGDLNISMEEYEDQIIAAGGNQSQARATYNSMDTDHNGIVSIDEFAATVDYPLGADSTRQIQQILDQITGGQSTAKPTGNILNAQGRVNDPDQLLSISSPYV